MSQPSESGMIDLRRLTISATYLMSTVVAIAIGTWVVAAEVNEMGQRFSKVENAVDELSREVGILSRLVDRGVSVAQFSAWLTLLRAQLRSVDVKLSDSIPGLPERDTGR